MPFFITHHIFNHIQVAPQAANHVISHMLLGVTFITYVVEEYPGLIPEDPYIRKFIFGSLALSVILGIGTYMILS